MSKKMKCLTLPLLFSAAISASAQTAPNVSQVLFYSFSGSNNQVPSIYAETETPAVFGAKGFGSIISDPSQYSSAQNFVQMSNALNASIATALSIIPLSSPASGVIERKDPVTGAELAESSTLGPIFTERAETIGKHHFYIGFSNQDFHFTKYNGTSLNGLSILYKGGQDTGILQNGSVMQTAPATFGLGMDVRLSQNIAFLTYGVTDRFDVSVGLPMVHSSVAAHTYNAQIFAGNGFGSNGSKCWCADTFTAATPTLILPDIGAASRGATGFGDLLVRVKGTVYRKPGIVIGLGADVRFPTGDASNYLGVGTTTLKPFAAVSFYTKPLRSGIVLSPHFDVGWQFSGKSILGAALSPTPQAGGDSFAPPFLTNKGYLPDVFTWAAGVELALGRRNTLVADILGNQVGWVHGIPNAVFQSVDNVPLPTSAGGNPGATPTLGSARGLVSAGNISFGQYSGSFGYKLKIAGNLIANVNALVRLDNNGLTSRFVPLFGLGYSF